MIYYNERSRCTRRQICYLICRYRHSKYFLVNSDICNRKYICGFVSETFGSIIASFSLHARLCWFSPRDVLNLLHLANLANCFWNEIESRWVLRPREQFVVFIVSFRPIISIYSEKWFCWFSAVCESTLLSRINLTNCFWLNIFPVIF